MRLFRYRWIKTIIIIFVLMVIYSLLPLVSFYFVKGASKNDNNEKAVNELKNNEGVYFSFIVFGDNHAGLCFNDAAALKEIWNMNREDRFGKSPIDFVLSVGDVTLDGSRRQFLNYKKLQSLIKYPLVSAIGNHDEPFLFKEFCGMKEFVFVNRNSYFIVLDNEIGELSEKQFVYLEEKLKDAQKYENIFIAMHKPPFDPYQQEWYNMDNSPWAFRFRKLCARYNVDMVFSGHKHMFKSETFDGVENVVTGGGGMLIEIPEADGGYLHYVKVTVNHDYVKYEVRKVSPPLWEYVTYYFWKEAVYWAGNFYGAGYILGNNTKKAPLRVKNLNDREYWMTK